MQITLRAARVNSGLTQEEAANSIGVSRLSIINWEDGRKQPRPEHLDNLLQLYGVSREDIFLPSQST